MKQGMAHDFAAADAAPANENQTPQRDALRPEAYR